MTTETKMTLAEAEAEAKRLMNEAVRVRGKEGVAMAEKAYKITKEYTETTLWFRFVSRLHLTLIRIAEALR